MMANDGGIAAAARPRNSDTAEIATAAKANVPDEWSMVFGAPEFHSTIRLLVRVKLCLVDFPVMAGIKL
jgi:hypothetical protein